MAPTIPIGLPPGKPKLLEQVRDVIGRKSFSLRTNKPIPTGIGVLFCSTTSVIRWKWRRTVARAEGGHWPTVMHSVRELGVVHFFALEEREVFLDFFPAYIQWA
jgi:hypothetical protein